MKKTRHPELVSLHGLRVLIVDDNQTNRVILEEMLKNWHMAPTAVAGGSAALAEMDKALHANEVFQLVLLDLMMPQMNGFALTERIRQTPDLSETPIIMLSSAWNSEGDGRCRELGIDHCLIKPVKQSDLLDAIVTILRVATADENPAQADTRDQPAQVSALKILLAEDGLVNQKVAVNLLELRGHRVTVANNGQEALNKLENESFDVVLMDVQMPIMDGLEATGLIRQREQVSGAHIPIIAMTAHAMKGDRERCLAAGMDGYIPKPIRAQDLYTAVEAITAGLQESQYLDEESGDKTKSLDRAYLLEQSGGSEATLKEVVDLFALECPQLMQQIRDAMTDANPAALQRAAHTLKGSIQFFGAEDAAAAALRLEQMGREQDLSQAETAWLGLVREIERLMPKLNDLTET